jgi:hypothetical protein
MILNGTITIKPAPQNNNPESKYECVTIEYHGLDGKYLSCTRFAGDITKACQELLDITSDKTQIAWKTKIEV